MLALAQDNFGEACEGQTVDTALAPQQNELVLDDAVNPMSEVVLVTGS